MYLKNFLATISLSFLGLLFAQPVYATNFWQNFDTSVVLDGNFIDNADAWTQSFGCISGAGQRQQFVAEFNGTINSIQDISLNSFSNTSGYIDAWNETTNITKKLYFTTSTALISYNINNFTTSSGLVVSVNDKIHLTWNSGSGLGSYCSGYVKTPSTTYTNTLANDKACSSLAGFDCIDEHNPQNFDIWVKINYEPTNTNLDDIGFNCKPIITNDFYNWSVGLSVTTTIDDSYYAYVDWDTESHSIPAEYKYHDVFPIFWLYDNYENLHYYDLSIRKEKSIATSTVIYARTSFTKNGVLLFYSNEWEFGINNSSTIFTNQCSTSTLETYRILGNDVTYTVPTATSTTNGDNLTCDTEDNFFTKSLCHLFNYLIVPSPKITDKFKILKTDLELKPPFGYFTIYQNEIDSLFDNTATSSIDYSITNTMTGSFFDLIKNLISVAIYLMTALFVFQRLRHFNFHE